MSEEHSRTYTWKDPLIGAKAAMELSGMDYLTKMLNGEIPGAPIANTMNFWLEELGEGVAIFKANPADFLYNPIGTVHGGFAATLLDSALGCCVHTTLEAGTAYTTAELHVNYVRPITADSGTLTCTGTVIHRGRKLATAEAKLTDEKGKLYAHGTTTCMIMEL